MHLPKCPLALLKSSVQPPPSLANQNLARVESLARVVAVVVVDTATTQARARTVVARVANLASRARAVNHPVEAVVLQDLATVDMVTRVDTKIATCAHIIRTLLLRPVAVASLARVDPVTVASLARVEQALLRPLILVLADHMVINMEEDTITAADLAPVQAAAGAEEEQRSSLLLLRVSNGLICVLATVYK